MTPHDHPAVRDAALKLISPASDLYDQALLMHHQPGEWRLGRLIDDAANVRAGLDALDAALAQAQAEDVA